MAWNDSDEIVIFGDGEAYYAPVGTTLPAKGSSPTAALNAAFNGVGYWTEDGVIFRVTPTITDTRAAQALQALRSELTALECQCQFNMLQWDENTLPLALGGSVNVSGGVATYTPPTVGAAITDVSLVVDVRDGSKNYRWVYPRGHTIDAVETTWQRGNPATLPVNFNGFPPATGGDPFYFMTDDPAFAAGS